MTLKLTRGAVLCVCAITIASAQNPNSEKDLLPNGRRIGTIDSPRNAPNEPPGQAGKPPKPGGGNGISYHNGPVMTNAIQAYFIWYGDWTGSVVPPLLEHLIRNIGASDYWNINTTYYYQNNTTIQHVPNIPITVKSVTPATPYKYGKSLSDSAIASIVSDEINRVPVPLPKDVNGVYFVLTSADVTASSGFCTQYCGWHTYGTLGGTPIKYSFVGDSTRCPSSCQAQSQGPNGSSGADGMASIIAHELAEAVTDPELNAWYDSRGYENADKCAWTFGTTSTLPNNGPKYNMTLNGVNYLIQRNWVNASGGYCSMTY